MLPPMKRPLNSSRSILNKRAILCRRSEEHTSELQSRLHLVCRLLLEKKKTKYHEVYKSEYRWSHSRFVPVCCTTSCGSAYGRRQEVCSDVYQFEIQPGVAPCYIVCDH